MKSAFATPALALLAGLLLLAGCAGPSPRAPAPVATRPASPPPPPPPPPPGNALPERTAPGVDVSPTPLEPPAVVEPRPLTEPSSVRAAGAPSSAPRQPLPAGGEASSPGAAPAAASTSDALAYAAPAPSTSPAVSDLLREMRRHRADGRYEMAAASLERALRIEPRNAYLWQHLAALRLEQGRAAQAEQFAAKSNSFAGDSAALRLRNWRIIAAARRQAGDARGARAAEQRAAGYER